jgi:hypothetical protein
MLKVGGLAADTSELTLARRHASPRHQRGILFGGPDIETISRYFSTNRPTCIVQTPSRFGYTDRHRAAGVKMLDGEGLRGTHGLNGNYY